MKYKVGDKVRLKNGDLVEIKHCIQLLSMPPQDAYIVKSAIKDNGEFTIREDTMSEVSEWSNEPKPKHPSKHDGLNTHYSMITALQEQVEIKQKEIDQLLKIIEKQRRIVMFAGNGLRQLSAALLEMPEEIK